MRKQEKTWATVSHLGGFAGYIIPFGNIIIPLVIWLVKKEDSKIIAENSKEALNFQISMTIYSIVAILLAFALIGIPLVIALLVINIIFIIKAAVAANQGQSYRYPLTIRLIK